MPRVAVANRVAVSNRVNGSGRGIIGSRQNLITDSEGMGGAGNWTDLGASGVASATTNPFGGANGAAIVEDNANSTHERYPSASLQNVKLGGWNCVSVFLSPDTRTFGGLIVDIGAYMNLIGCWNLSTGANTQFTATSTNGAYVAGSAYQVVERESWWTPGWRRYTMAWQMNLLFPPIQFFPGRIFLSQAGAYVAYVGDGVSRLFAWGQQYTHANWEGPYTQTNPGIVNPGPLRNLNSR